MKTTIRSFVIAAAFLTALSVQAQKFGHVHLDSLIAMMPEFKESKQKGQDYYKELESRATFMQKELETKYKDYQEKESSMTDLIKQSKQKELQDMQQRLQEFQQGAQQDIQKKEAELAKPVYDKAKKAIEQVAKEGGYRYVFDTSNGTVLYSEQSDNVIAMVKKKLGIVGMGALDEVKKADPPKAPVPAPTPGKK